MAQNDRSNGKLHASRPNSIPGVFRKFVRRTVVYYPNINRCRGLTRSLKTYGSHYLMAQANDRSNGRLHASRPNSRCVSQVYRNNIIILIGDGTNGILHDMATAAKRRTR
jgi:hypothetical protein